MDTAMRDLEQIQEVEGTGDKRGVVFFFGALFVCLLAYGLGRGASDSSEAPAVDPLSALHSNDAIRSAAASESAALPEVDRRDLTFPSNLMADERPEVAATLAQAAAEEASLGAARLDVDVPAAVLATPEEGDLRQQAAHDPMVAHALTPSAPSGERGAVGQDGEFTLQVISYRTEQEANVFADALRLRGHDAFVMAADVADRGTFYRVRIGPFENQGEAENYRRSFEANEQISAFVVRRR